MMIMTIVIIIMIIKIIIIIFPLPTHARWRKVKPQEDDKTHTAKGENKGS